ncbi:MAG: hypothetical protein RLZZ436_364 [Planctomycetota bacterium]|jgi:hypothetical protein
MSVNPSSENTYGIDQQMDGPVFAAPFLRGKTPHFEAFFRSGETEFEPWVPVWHSGFEDW